MKKKRTGKPKNAGKAIENLFVHHEAKDKQVVAYQKIDEGSIIRYYKARDKRPPAYEILKAAKLGVLAKSRQMPVARKLEQLAKMKVWKEYKSDLYDDAGGDKGKDKIHREVLNHLETYLKGSIRAKRSEGKIVPILEYDAKYLRELADCVEALGKSVQPLHQVLQSIHRKENTVAQTAKIAAPYLGKEDNSDFRKEVKKALKLLEFEFIDGKRGRPRTIK